MFVGGGGGVGWGGMHPITMYVFFFFFSSPELCSG